MDCATTSTSPSRRDFLTSLVGGRTARAVQSPAMILQGKTIVVSGVGPGLGKEVVTLALRDGANVVLAARGADRLNALAKELDSSGARTEAKCSKESR